MADKILTDETNRRFWARTNYKPGARLDPKDPVDRGMAKIWLDILAEVRGYRQRATARAARELQPYVLVREGPSGLTALAFARPFNLDIQYDWEVDQPGYEYLGTYVHGQPTREHFAAVVPPESSPSASALAQLRREAARLAGLTDGNAIGVVRNRATGQWQMPTFPTVEAAIQWLHRVRQHPTWFQYAACFDRQDPRWPQPIDEEVGRVPARDPAPAVAGYLY